MTAVRMKYLGWWIFALALLAVGSAMAEPDDPGGADTGIAPAMGVVRQTFTRAQMTDGGAAACTIALAQTIPDGALVVQSTLSALTGFTGNVSAVITVGDGTDVDRYNTGTPSVFTTNASGVALGVPSGTAWHDDAKTITVTITGSTDCTAITAGQATVSVYYYGP